MLYMHDILFRPLYFASLLNLEIKQCYRSGWTILKLQSNSECVNTEKLLIESNSNIYKSLKEFLEKGNFSMESNHHLGSINRETPSTLVLIQHISRTIIPRATSAGGHSETCSSCMRKYDPSRHEFTRKRWFVLCVCGGQDSVGMFPCRRVSGPCPSPVCPSPTNRSFVSRFYSMLYEFTIVKQRLYVIRIFVRAIISNVGIFHLALRNTNVAWFYVTCARFQQMSFQYNRPARRVSGAR